MSEIALVGKPNSGKSSLFNLITGLNQKIANYSGATVESKVGAFHSHKIIDLPGLNSLRTVSAEEEISRDQILEYAENKSPIIFVCNGMQLEDNLLLFSEIADLQIPALLLINFKDDLDKNHIKVDQSLLADTIGCPVVMMNSRNGDGVDDLLKAINKKTFSIPNAVCRSLYDEFEGDSLVNKYADRISNFAICDTQLDQDDFFKRQKIIGSIVRNCISTLSNRQNFLASTKKWDRFLLHPVFGIATFLLTMLIIFQAVFYFAGIPMDWIDLGFLKLSEWSRGMLGDSWLGNMVCDGIIPGLGGVLIFIPQIAILFFLLGILEHSGYLSRISFISNRLLSKFGLSGQSVIPLMSSWACTIPAIMSARMINNPRERLAVIMASPLMTCSARLPVYTILIAIMFPGEDSGFFNLQGVLLLGLYLLGVVATLVMAYFVNRRATVESTDLWSLELPVYRIPNWRNVFYNVYLKTKAFVIDAGKVIFVVSMILWFLAGHSPKSESFFEKELATAKMTNPSISMDAVKLEYSYAGYMGKLIEPAIKPLGYDWKMGIAIISSFAAREVFVGSLATIYSVGSDEEDLIKNRLEKEINTETGERRYNNATIISLLLFYAFALQCMSTMAIVRRETNSWKYPLVQFVVMLVLAYVSAFIGYRLFL